MGNITSFFKRKLIPNPENSFRPKAFETRYLLIAAGILFAIKFLSVFSFNNFLGANIFNQLATSDLYSLVNNIRVADKEQSLKVNPSLEAAAQLKLADMFANNYFGHYSPQGKSPWFWFARMKYNYQAAGENLAMDFQSSQEVVEAWMNSELHKRNILYKDFTETGIAVGKGEINGQERMVVVQLFGKPAIPVKTAKIQPSKNLAYNTSQKTKTLAQGVVKGALDEGKNSYLAQFFGNTLNFVLIIIALFLGCLLVFASFKSRWLAKRVLLLLLIVVALIFIQDYRFIGNQIQIGPDGAVNQTQ